METNSSGPEVPGPPYTEDLFLGGRLRIRQPERGFRAGMDSVLLPAAVSAVGGTRVLDAGAGVGVGALCLLARLPLLSVTALEIDPETAQMARMNAALNGLSLEVETGDFLGALLPHRREAFDQVMTNPPYLEPGEGTAPPLPDKARAFVAAAPEGRLTAAWIEAAHRHLRPGGILTLIHRADRLADVIAPLSPGFGDVRVFPLWPFEGEAARRIIVSARKASRSPSRLLPGLVLHTRGERSSEAATAVLRDGAALDLWGASPGALAPKAPRP